MALTLVVEDGTGLETANVYDLAAAAGTFLSDRGHTVFAAGTDPEKDQWLLEATVIMERHAETRVSGAPVNGDDQAMLFPRNSSVDRRFKRHDFDERPAVYREGIFLLAEDVAIADGAGVSVTAVELSSYVKRHKESAGAEIEYFSEASLADKHPAAFDTASGAYPAGIRSFRA